MINIAISLYLVVAILSFIRNCLSDRKKHPDERGGAATACFDAVLWPAIVAVFFAVLPVLFIEWVYTKIVGDGL